MLCACSRDQKNFHFEDAPQSPESLAARDFSVSGLSSRTGEIEQKFDDSQIDDIESSLRETLSLNYEEARALLGRLEYQRGNFDAALQVFQGIDVKALKPRMVKAIIERSRHINSSKKGGALLVNIMSMHSVSLLLEAILLKSKTLQELRRVKDAAIECRTIVEIMESAWPYGMHNEVKDDFKLIEIFHKALELLPKLWKQAGYLDEAIHAYRQALTKPWVLDQEICAKFQKDLATILLYSGEEETLPEHIQQEWGSNAPKTNAEEAILLLLILKKKMMFNVIIWDSEIMNHLIYALSLSNQFELLAQKFEELLPGVYNRGERWYSLALCYSAAGMDDVALNLLKKFLGHSERNLPTNVSSFLLGLKLCGGDITYTFEGKNYAKMLVQCSNDALNHFSGLSSHLIGVWKGNLARLTTNDSERYNLQKEALVTLRNAASLEYNDPEIIYSLGMELAMQRKVNQSKEFAVKYVDLVSGSSIKGWRLLAYVVSQEQEIKDAESIVEYTITHSGIESQLRLLRDKALLQIAQEQPKTAIETYRILLALLQSQKESQIEHSSADINQHKTLEMESWVDLATIYTKLELYMDSDSCLDIAKSVEYFNATTWHTFGMNLEAQSKQREALCAYWTSLSIEPDYVPSMISIGSIMIKTGGKSLPIARSFLMNALKMEPMNHDAWLKLGLVFKKQGSFREAADCFQKACELEESSSVLKLL